MGYISLLEATCIENKAYYEALASFYYNGRFRHPNNYPGRLAYNDSLFGLYAYNLALLMNQHYESIGSPDYYVVTEFGGAEGLVLSKVLNFLKGKKIYDVLRVYLVDFAETYRPHQIFNLNIHLDKVSFTDKSPPEKSDFVILSEFLDDLESVSLCQRGLPYISAFETTSKEIVYVPHTNFLRDYELAISYAERYKLQWPFIAYLGVENYFNALSSNVRKGGVVYVMDYMIDYPNTQFSPPVILIDDRITINGISVVNITSILSAKHLVNIAINNGFGVISSGRVQSSFNYGRTYYWYLFKKNL